MFLGGTAYINAPQANDIVAATTNFIICNPYEDVDWDEWSAHRASLHVHTPNSDGRYFPSFRHALLDHFQKGYDIIAMTEHWAVTPALDQRPWTFGVREDIRRYDNHAAWPGIYPPLPRFNFEYLSSAERQEFYTGAGRLHTLPLVSSQWQHERGTRAQTPGMIGIPNSSEQSHGHHILTYWAPINSMPYWGSMPSGRFRTSGAPGLGEDWLEYALLQRTLAVDGLAVLAHPGRHTGGDGGSLRCPDDGARVSNTGIVYDRYVEMFRRFPNVVGMEIFNRLDDESRSDRILWDNILQQTMPHGRNVFGFANDDSHGNLAVGYHWNMFFLPPVPPESRADAVRHAVETGAFYTVARVDRRLRINHELPDGNLMPDGAGDATTVHLWELPEPPGIERIEVGADSITIDAVRYNEIQWIGGDPNGGGRVIHTGSTLYLDDVWDDITSNYVRAQILYRYDIDEDSYVFLNGVAMTQPFGVRVAPIAPNTLTGFTPLPAVINAHCYAAPTALALGLPGSTSIQTSRAHSFVYAHINWDLSDVHTVKCGQIFVVNGQLELPRDVDGIVDNLDLNVTITVNVVCRLWHYDSNPNSWAVDYLVNACYRNMISRCVLQSSVWREGIPRFYIADLAARFIETHTGMSIGAFVASRDPDALREVPFDDNTDPDVIALARLGVILGQESYQWEGLRFNPHGLIDRQSAAVVLGRLVELFDGEVPEVGAISQDDLPFDDAVPSWARGSVYFLYHQSPRILSNTNSHRTGQPGADPNNPNYNRYLFSPQMTFQNQMMVMAMVRTLNVLAGGTLSIDFAQNLSYIQINNSDGEDKDMKKVVCTLLACAMLFAMTPATGGAEATLVTSGVVTENGSNLPWRLYSDGALIVDEGFIERIELTYYTRHSPWINFRDHIVTITFTGPVTGGNSLASLFAHLWRLEEIEGLHYFDLSNVTEISAMFRFDPYSGPGWGDRQGSRLTSLDLSVWDVSNVTHMGGVFWGANSLTDLNISGWDTSNVTTMIRMFQGINSLTSLDVSGWDTSNVTNMHYMFTGASSLTYLDVSGWDVSNVVGMTGMFGGASGLTHLDVSGWDVSNVTSTSSMFSGARGLTSLDLSSWDTSSVTNMSFMFRNADNLRKLILGEDFIFGSNVWIPAGNWQNVGSGTIANPQGAFTFTAAGLAMNYNGAIHADTWVRAPHPVYRYDNNPNSWAREYLERAYDDGLISPRVLENNNWRDGIRRVYIADLAARFIEMHTGESISDFVAAQSSLYPVLFTDTADVYALYLAQLGVMLGVESYQWPGVEFRPNDYIDRQSAAALLGRLLALFDGEVPPLGAISQSDLPFQDAVPSWARGSVYFLYNQAPSIMRNTSSVEGMYLFAPRMQFQCQKMVIALVRALDVLS